LIFLVDFENWVDLGSDWMTSLNYRSVGRDEVVENFHNVSSYPPYEPGGPVGQKVVIFCSSSQKNRFLTKKVIFVNFSEKNNFL